MVTFYAAAITALALQIGHRISTDLDWFSHSRTLQTPERDQIRELLASGDDFEDAEQQPMPRMLLPVLWKDVPAYCESAARNLGR